MTGTRLAKNAETVLSALKRAGPGWHPRASIAQKMHKGRLSQGEVAALELLIERGDVEVRRVEIEGPIPLRWEYRITK